MEQLRNAIYLFTSLYYKHVEKVAYNVYSEVTHVSDNINDDISILGRFM